MFGFTILVHITPSRIASKLQASLLLDVTISSCTEMHSHCSECTPSSDLNHTFISDGGGVMTIGIEAAATLFVMLFVCIFLPSMKSQRFFSYDDQFHRRFDLIMERIVSHNFVLCFLVVH